MIKSNIRKHILPHDNVVIKENNQVKQETMDTKNLEQMEMLANNLNDEKNTKHIKKDKGLIERVESHKTMLTEDNKQLMLD